MTLTYEKITEDKRGKIIWITCGNTEIHIVEIKKGFSRGGHFHRFDSVHIITSGKIEYRETNLQNCKEMIRVVEPVTTIRTPANGAHLITAIEDSTFVEVFDTPYEAEIFSPYRQIVEKKMNSG